MREKNIYEKIAEKYNTTPEEVRREMQIAIDDLLKQGGNGKDDQLPPCVGGIGMMAFARNVIREIVIPDSVRYIDAEAFYSCNNLDTKFLSSQPEDRGFSKDYL